MTARLQELARMPFEQLLTEAHLGEDELRLVQKRVEEEEARLDALQQQGPSAALDAVQRERDQLREDSAKLERVAEHFEMRARALADLDAKNRELSEQADAMERHLGELRAQRAGLGAVEATMDDRVTNHLLGICNRVVHGYAAPIDVLAREDEHDYFVSQSDAAGQVMCEMLVPKEWVPV